MEAVSCAGWICILFALLETCLGCGCGGGGGGSNTAPQDCPLGTGTSWTVICKNGTVPTSANNYCMYSNANTFISDSSLNIVMNNCPDHVNNAGVVRAPTAMIIKTSIVELSLLFVTLNYSVATQSVGHQQELKLNITNHISILANTSMDAISVVSFSAASGSQKTVVVIDVTFSGNSSASSATSFVSGLPPHHTFGGYGVANISAPSQSCWGSLKCHLKTGNSCGCCSGCCSSGCCSSSSSGGCSSSSSGCSSSWSSSSCCSSGGSCSSTNSSTSGGCCSSSSGCSSSGCCSSSCCSGCSSSGGCCSLGTYDPSYHSLYAKIPAIPAIDDSTSSIVLLNGHQPVGVSVSGIMIETAQVMTKVFDSCMGHVDAQHAYHYHLPPVCLFSQLGIPTPANTSYWLDEQPNRYATYWNATADPSPIVGYALDGFPIMGPYDSNGTLVLGSDTPGSSLDLCNGKQTPDGYRYFWTPTPPFVPRCFKGKKGALTLQMTGQKCPAGGTENRYLYNTTALTTSMAASGKTLFSGSCATTSENFMFLFRTVPPLDSLRWQIFAYLFGIVMLLQAATAIYYMVRGRKIRWRLIVGAFVTVATLSRVLFYFIDPFYTRRVLPQHLVGVLYGLMYPSINLCLAIMLLNIIEVMLSIIESAKKLSAAKKIKEFLPRTRWGFFVFAFLEFTTQITADLMRAEGVESPVLIICQVYFIGFGLFLACGYLWFRATVQSESMQSIRPKLAELEQLATFIGVFSVIFTVISIISIMTALLMNLDDDSYFILMLLKQLVSCTIIQSMLYSIRSSNQQTKKGHHRRPSQRRAASNINSSHGSTSAAGINIFSRINRAFRSRRESVRLGRVDGLVTTDIERRYTVYAPESSTLDSKIQSSRRVAEVKSIRLAADHFASTISPFAGAEGVQRKKNMGVQQPDGANLDPLSSAKVRRSDRSSSKSRERSISERKEQSNPTTDLGSFKV